MFLKAVTRLSPPVLFLARTSRTCGGTHRLRGHDNSAWAATFLLLMFILPNVGSTHVTGLKFTQSSFSKVINLQTIVFKFMYNQRCSLSAKSKDDDAFFFLKGTPLHQSFSDYLSRLPFTSVQIAQQSKAAVGELVTVFFLQTPAIGWIDGGEVAAVHRRPPLLFGQNQRHQLWTTSTSVLQHNCSPGL